MMELASKDLKIAIISMFKDFKENLNNMREQIGNVNREMETMKKDLNGYYKTKKYTYEILITWAQQLIRYCRGKDQ